MLLSATGRWGKKPNRYQRLMIRPALIIVSVATALFLTACESDQSEKPHPKKHPFGYPGNGGTEVAPEPSGGGETTGGPSTPSPGPGSPTGPIAPPPPPPPSNPNPTPGATGPAQVKDDPYGTPVPGKPGFVTSPFAPQAGYVDVRGFPPGTPVKDPYTGKVFLVP